ncbi:hypothetical protein TNCV_1585831 [Trichonephila clavipes]|nr:hypothetical protein TNCV_1585831 [Trichonephila clavipes]
MKALEIFVEPKILLRGLWKGKRGGGHLQNWGGTEPKCSFTCMTLKVAENVRRNLTPCHEEHRGCRSDLTTVSNPRLNNAGLKFVTMMATTATSLNRAPGA